MNVEGKGRFFLSFDLEGRSKEVGSFSATCDGKQGNQTMRE